MTSSHPQEIELKLQLSPARAGAFRAMLARRRVRPVEQELVTLYLDTPDFDLGTAGVAVRLRRVGRRWLQTLKTEGERQGGLSRRAEFEMPVPRGELDWALFPPEAQAYVPVKRRARLVPVFETRFTRTAWQLGGAGGAAIEVALDVGEVRAGEAAMPICEIELELKSGEPDALYDLALDWARRFDCLPFDQSKAERGMRLACCAADAPVKPVQAGLDRAMRVEDGFAAICQACLTHFQANLPGVLDADDIEYVHQARVALRRLRAALRLYRRVCVLPPELSAGLRALAAALGPARDLDVLCSETLPAIAPHYDDTGGWQAGMATLAAHRAAARNTMRAAIAAAHPGAWLLDCHRWLMQRGWRAAPEAQRFVQLSPLSGWAARALQRGHRAVLRDAVRFSTLSPPERHGLRIRIKRQRYAVEFFESLYPGRAHARYRVRLCLAQDALGRANDVRVAMQQLKSLQHELDAMGTFALGWLAACEAGAGGGENAKHLKNFVKLRVDW